MTRPWLVLALAVLPCGARPLPAQSDGPPRVPADSVRIVTSDIPNFWRAWDRAQGRDSAARVRAFEELYLRPGSPGLRDWTRVRLMEWKPVRARMVAAGWSGEWLDSVRRAPRDTPGRDSLERVIVPFARQSGAEALVQAIARAPRYYADIRARTLAVDTARQVTAEIRRGLRRLDSLHPGARFPHVYFLIGTLSTGGTVGPHGLLIGTEQYGGGPATPRDELPGFFAEILASHTFEKLPGLVVHEAVHSLQPERRPATLLEAVLHEGVADFVSELAVGPWHGDTPRQRWGRAHEREVWLDFRDEMRTPPDSTMRTWMYNGMVPAPANHGALDIGYWVGYAIAKAYWERAGGNGQRTALRELILLPDAERLLRESGYDERWGAGAGASAGGSRR